MIPSTNSRLRMRILLVHEAIDGATAPGMAIRALTSELASHEVEIVTSASAADARSVLVSDASIGAILVDWSLSAGDADPHAGATSLLELARSRNATLPIFLMAERDGIASLPLAVLRLVDEFVWLLEDSAPFVAGRLVVAMQRYAARLLPPMASALLGFAAVHEYSWHTPGHTGGTAFLKSPVGRVFHDFFGENLLRSDLSISVGELGSLLDHSGPIGEGEKYAARVFGSHRSYTVTNGTSTSNRLIFTASLVRDQVALCDRNCHKSIEHGLTLTGAIPTYLVPSRNRYGVIGPIHPERLAPEAVRAAIEANPLVDGSMDHRPAHCVITNSTYDGLCYRTTRVLELLDPTVDRVHFDEAWYAYARFNPIYRDRHGMNGDPADHRGPTVFATHSTHKLLAALSQASFIHVRDGRNPIDHARFNESFMMHASTSPLYTIIASNDVSAAMMDGPGGVTLTTEAIEEAVGFRQMVGRIRKELAAAGEWFFATWNAETVTDPQSGRRLAFEEAPEDLLVRDPGCWVLHPGESWHGFADLEDDYCMLDPIKVSVLTPGIAPDGGLEAQGIPASLVTAYLDARGIEVEKTTDFTILFLFSIGITRGKWGTLLNALLDFKRDFDANLSLERAIPALMSGHPKRYAGLGLRDLAREMFELLKESGQVAWLAEAFSTLPRPVLSPALAYQEMVRNRVEQVPLEQLPGRVVATGVVPYPPGIPMLMPGENAGTANGPHLAYLGALQAWDRRFPGFEHDTHGVENLDGTYHVCCVRA